MSQATVIKEPGGKLQDRIEELFKEQQNKVYRRTDALFSTLLIVQWLTGIIIALVFSPLSWSGSNSSVHIHVWTAIFLGAAIIALPVYLAKTQPGSVLTRHCIAIGQMLVAALLIHLCGGRIEAHFHIFGSLAFLSFYRDWRVLVSASIIVTLDHILRGIYYPQSIYGSSTIEQWRWLEHTWWVLFEDAFLIRSCFENTNEMRAIATRQAQLEEHRDKTEDVVRLRTKELLGSKRKLAAQYAITSSLNGADSVMEAAPQIIGTITKSLLGQNGVVAGVMRTVDKQSGKFKTVGQFQYAADKEELATVLSNEDLECLSRPALFQQTRISGALMQFRRIPGLAISSTDAEGTMTKKTLKSALVIPLKAKNQVCGVIEFFAEAAINLDETEISMLESIGQQVGAFSLKRQIEAENRQLANMVHWSGDAIVGQTVSGIITSWNKGAQNFFGYSAEQMIGQDISILCPENKLAELNNLKALSQMGKVVEGMEIERLTSDGKLVHVSLTRSPVYDDNKQIAGISSVMHDITARKEAERRVSEFYSIVSHELRTPLTSIRGVLGLIEGGVVEGDSDEAKNLIGVARESTDRLIRLINDMLDLKKIESGKMELQRTLIAPRTLVKDCIESLRAMADIHDVKLCQEGTAAGEVFADHDKITQVLTNLISNAVKFSPPGSEVRVFWQCDKNGMMRFNIVDNGPGIAAVDINKLFQKFQQLDSSDTRQQGGTGLGLAICKALVEEHNGTIGVRSRPGKGSTFWFELPLAPAAAAEIKGSGAEQIKEEIEKTATEKNEAANTKFENIDGIKSILLVEDDGGLASVLTALFRHSGYKTVVADTLHKAQQHLHKEQFSVVVLDLVLPDGNGLDLLETIKKTETLASLPVIVITAHSLDKKYIDDESVADWLPKPFNNDTLIKAIDRLTAAKELTPCLIAGSDDDCFKSYEARLQALGLHSREARDAAEAVLFGRQLRADVIILDVSLIQGNLFENETKAGRKMKVRSNDRGAPLLVYSRNLWPVDAVKPAAVVAKGGGDDLNNLPESILREQYPHSDLIDTVSALLEEISL